MATFTLPDGTQIDLDSGEVVGQGEPAKLTAAEAAMPTVDIPASSVGQGAIDAINQFSAGFNTMLFSLPDATLRAVGKAANVKEEEIPQFINFFNRGEFGRAPKNAVERFASALGKGAGATVPFTGLLGAVARTNVLRSALPTDAGIAKRVAKDMLDFTRANPALAVSTDLGFGAAYGGLEQSVEEFAAPGPGKDILKVAVPLLGVTAVPLAGAKILDLAGRAFQLSPTVQVAKAMGQRGDEMFGGQAADTYAAQLAKERTLRFPGLTGIQNMAFKGYAKSAEKNVKDVLDVLVAKPGQERPPGVEQALLVSQAIEADPRLSGMFLFDAAEQALYAPIILARNKAYSGLTGDLLADAQRRYAQNTENFLSAADTFAPKAGMPLEDALRLSFAEQNSTVANAAKQLRDLQEGEALRVADAFAVQNIDEIGDSLRSGILAQMDGQFFKLRKQAEGFGALSGVDAEGVKIATMRAGKPLFPAVDFEPFARKLNARFKLGFDERMFPEGAPTPVRMVNSVLQRLQQQRQEAADRLIPKVVEEKLRTSGDSYRDGPPDATGKPTLIKVTNEKSFFKMLSPREQKEKIDQLSREIILGKPAKAATSPRRGIQGSDIPLVRAQTSLTDAQIQEVRSEALEMAKNQVQSVMTFPDALDLLGAAQNFRNRSIHVYNRELGLGTARSQAKPILDRGEAVLRDVEEFVFNEFNKQAKGPLKSQGEQLQDWMQTYKDTYAKGYETLFPLMVSKRDPRGNFYTNNEQVVNKALSSAQNIRDMNAIFGDDAGYARILQNVMFDRARTAPGVIDKNGLLNPQGLESFLTSRQMRPIVEALPDPVRASLTDELKIGQGMAQRMREMEERVELVKDDELVQMLKKAVRPDADPRQLVQQAITDPAVMRKLVSTVGKDPERRAALQRSVWDTVRGDLTDSTNPLFLQDFIKRNSKSLNILYDKQHMDDLNLLSEIQRRVFVGESPAGQLSPFRGLDAKLREKIGAGIGTIEATTRAAMIRQISPIHAGVSLLSRYVTRQQTAIYEAVMYKALTDPDYAHQLVTANMPLESKKGTETMSKLVFKSGHFLPATLRVAGIEAVQATEDQETARPVSLAQPTGTMPPVPAPVRSLSQSAPARTIPQLPPRQTQNLGQSYEALFPNDAIAPLLKARQTQPQ